MELAAAAFLELFLLFLLCFLAVLVVLVDVLLALGAFCAAKAVPSTIAAPIINAVNFFMTVSFPLSWGSDRPHLLRRFSLLSSA